MYDAMWNQRQPFKRIKKTVRMKSSVKGKLCKHELAL